MYTCPDRRAPFAELHHSCGRTQDFALPFLSPYHVDPSALPSDLFLDIFLLTLDGPPELLRVMDYLASEKDREEDLWLQDDLQIAWLTCLYAGRGDPLPHVSATYKVLGLPPEKVGAAIVERRRALLGSCFVEGLDSQVVPPSQSSPKKPVARVEALPKKEIA